MSEFTKGKIGFAVALLVALFTIHPVIAASTSVVLTIFSLVFE